MTIPEEHVELVDVSGVEADGVRHLRRDVLERQEVVGHLRRAGHLAGSLEAKNEEVEHEAVVLDDERSKLQAADDAVRVGVVHVLQTPTTNYRPVKNASIQIYLCIRLHRHIHRSTAIFLGQPGWAGTRKVKPVWILPKQETVSGSGISWAV